MNCDESHCSSLHADFTIVQEEMKCELAESQHYVNVNHLQYSVVYWDVQDDLFSVQRP